MRKLNLILFLFAMTSLFAQDNTMLQKNIDDTLWKPFKIAFETLDATKLNALYADEVLRVTPNGIDTDENFKTSNKERFQQNKAAGIRIQLDFWFDSRHTNTHTSYEVGVYRMQMKNEKGTNTVYGQFHIVLQKIGDNWRITQDWDTASVNGRVLTAVDFDKNPPLVFE